ncbi:MAG: hypothetical protein ABIH23_00285, partial [bacterium]
MSNLMEKNVRTLLRRCSQHGVLMGLMTTLCLLATLGPAHSVETVNIAFLWAEAKLDISNQYHNDCSADYLENSLTTDYNGNIYLEVQYSGDEDYHDCICFRWWHGETLIGSRSCDDDCSGYMDPVLFPVSNGTAMPSLSIRSRVDSHQNCDCIGEQECQRTNTKTISLTRPKCPSTTTIDNLGTYPLSTSLLNITGTVADDKVHSGPTANNTVTLTIVEPGGSFNVNLDVNSGQFSYAYNFGNAIGRYTATADYNGASNAHSLLPSS